MTNFLDSLQPLAQSLGLAVAHSVWQIAAIFLVFKILSRLTTRSEAARYGLAVLAMTASFGWFLTTFQVEFVEARREFAERKFLLETFPTADFSEKTASPETALTVPKPASENFFSKKSLVRKLNRAEFFIQKNAPLIGMVWSLVAAVLLLRLVGAYWLIVRLLRRGATPLAADFQQKCTAWSARLGIRQRVRWLESRFVQEPLTVGFWKPVVLFPAGMALQLPPEQVEALLLHELAHIRRHDYLVNLLQLVLEAVFFYHPLFWMLSREARTRREFCCDDLVVRFTHDRIGYARTLTELKLSTTHFTQNQLVMQATGKNNFTARILRIARPNPKNASRPAGFLPFLLFLIVGSTVVFQAAPSRAASLVAELQPLNVVLPEVKPAAVFSNFKNENSEKPALPEPVETTPTTPELADFQQIETDSTPPAQSVAMELSKMNVMYIGVDNPLTIGVPGVDCGKIEPRIKTGEGKLVPLGNCQYNVIVSRTGLLEIEVYASSKLLTVKQFRVKRIPDPAPMVNFYRSRQLPLEELKKFKNVSAILQNFDYEANCQVTSFEVGFLKKMQDPISIANNGADFNKRILELFETATPGTTIFVDAIRCKCPGDSEPRELGSLVFKIRD